MTERGAGALSRSANRLAIGPSALAWDGTDLTIDVAETAVPHLTPIRGRVRVMPEIASPYSTAIDRAGLHHWRAFAPAARVEVRFERPGIRWTGAGYFDGNFGGRPLEADFRRWTWSRAAGGGGPSVLYDTLRRDGSAETLALRFGRDGRPEVMEPPPVAALPRSLWRIRQQTRSDAGTLPRIVRRMEDAPFYARNSVEATLWGDRATGVHETLDLDRLDTRICRLMLPFRMPRRG